jgi:hypothetical protein
MITQISAPSTALYLKDFLSELPHGIVNKRSCGVGGSYISITSEENYIIACPTIELIVNKQHQHPNIIGVYGTAKFSEFKRQILERRDANAITKIMTTYDSLPKVVKWLEQLTQEPYSKYRLLVDEYHKILSDYSYRDKAIDGLLKEALKFTYCTFLSATPINPKFTPSVLADFPQYEIIWSATRKIRLEREKTNKPYSAAVNIIRKYRASGNKLKIDGQISEEAYFFINSVEGLAEIIKKAELKPEEVKIICADSDRNQQVLDRINPEYEFEIANVHHENKPFTFVTSKSFLGADFYSDSGIVYVVSNVHRKTTLLDISTDLYQIAGRIRNVNNPFKDRLYHIYNTGAYEMSPEEFQESVNEKIENTREKITVFNELMNAKQKKALLKMFELDIDGYYSYYNPDTGLLEFNELQKLNEEFNYSIVNEIYTNGLTLRDAYVNAGFDLTNNQNYTQIIDSSNTNLSCLTKQSFRDVIKEYVDCIDEGDIERANELIELEPEIKNVVEVLGTKRIRSLAYNKTKILKEVYSSCEEVEDVIKEEVEAKYQVGNFYSLQEIKKGLQEIYKRYSITKTPKASDISKYLNVSTNKKPVEGKYVNGYNITSLS